MCPCKTSERLKLPSGWSWVMAAKFSAACVVCISLKGKFLKGRMAKWEKLAVWNICYWNIAERKESMVHCYLAINYSQEKGLGNKDGHVELNLQESIENVIDLYCWPHNQSKWRIACCETFKRAKTNRAVIMNDFNGIHKNWSNITINVRRSSFLMILNNYLLHQLFLMCRS